MHHALTIWDIVLIGVVLGTNTWAVVFYSNRAASRGIEERIVQRKAKIILKQEEARETEAAVIIDPDAELKEFDKMFPLDKA